MIEIILVEPQMGENIGGAARVMKNFGLASLKIVNPRDGWPNERAEAISASAVDILHNAKIYSNLREASRDLEFLYATTTRKRHMNKNYITCHNLADKLPKVGKTGIMFGRESNGLYNEEIAHANSILTIPTAGEVASLNLSQAVGVICYELSSLIENNYEGNFRNTQKLAKRGDIDYFLDYLIEELDNSNFFKIPEKKQQMQINIRSIFSRDDKLSRSELQTLWGIVKSLKSSKN
jgi:tRNA/rRNA methyltransferase